MIVPDASVLVALILNGPEARAVAQVLRAADYDWHVPHLVDLEVTHVIRRFAIRGDISDERGALALSEFSKLDLQRYSHLFLLPRIWALRHNITAYDASYVALAESLGADLLTLDLRLAATARAYVRVPPLER